MHLAHKQFKVWDPRDPRRRSLGGGLAGSSGGNGARQKPAGVTWDPGFNVFYNGTGVPTTDFDFNAIQPVVTGTTYYVDPVTGLDTNTGLSPAQAFASFARGVGRVNTQSASLVHQVLVNLPGDTVFRATNAWGGSVTRSCVIKPIGGRILNIAAAPTVAAPVWTKTAGLTNVYETAVASAIVRVYDLSRKFTWAYSNTGRPYYQRYAKVADAATVDTTPDSFFYDSVGGKVYCNTSTRVPDGMVQPLMGVTNASWVPNTLGRILWATGIDFIGGGNGFSISELAASGGTGGDATLRAYLKDCSYQGPSRSADGFLHTGLGWTYHVNCGTYDTGVDGFSVYGLNAVSNTDPAGRRACIDCATYDNGETGQTQANGETLHSTAQGISVNCNIGPAYNRPLHDGQGTKHWFVGGSVGPSTHPQPDTTSRSVQSGNGPGQSCEVYLDGTVINPGSQYDLNTTAGSGLFFKGVVPPGLTVDPASAGTIAAY